MSSTKYLKSFVGIIQSALHRLSARGRAGLLDDLVVLVVGNVVQQDFKLSIGL